MLLVALLPFEPRAPWRVGPFGVTVLEAAAIVAMSVLAFRERARIIEILRRPAAPLVALGALALAHALSAILAPEGNASAAKFSLRMAVMAGFAVLVAALPARARRVGLVALAATAAVVAGLALSEGFGGRRLDPFLDLFRETPFNVGGVRRATAGSEYPNQAAAFMMCGLLVAAGLAGVGRRGLALAVGAGLLFTAGLLQTYSRGALVAAGLGLVVQAAAVGRGQRFRSAPLVALATLVLTAATFASEGEVFRLRLQSESAAHWYGALYEPTEASLALRPAEQRLTHVRLTNRGRLTWKAGEDFHLSYHWLDEERRTLQDGGRTRLPRDLRQDESVVLEALVVAPREEGRYLLVWDMVHEHTTWFSGQGVRVATVPVTVSRSEAAPPPPASGGTFDPDLAWRPTRGELWRLAFGMWEERPFAGFGSDRFRWLYGARAGRRFWDVRVFANNTLLETAADTGTMGVVALLATFLVSALAAGRAVSASAGADGVSLALLGLLAGLFAHGLVDYVLAFTGHYLLFAFVVGSCAGLSGPPPRP